MKREGAGLRLFLLVLGVGMVVVAVITGWFMDSDYWGAMGQWAGALGTVVAVWAALFIANRDAERAHGRAVAEASERYERDRAERDLREAEARRRDAREAAERLAVAEREASLVLCEVRWPPPDDPAQPTCLVTLKNFGDKPVLHPQLETFLHPDGGTAAWSFNDLNGRLDGYHVPGHLEPNGGRDLVPVDIVYEPAVPEAPGAEDFPVPIFSFTDCHGQRWRRVGTSLPDRVDPRDVSLLSGPVWYQQAHPGWNPPAPA